jgi:uncharacterized protein (TIGR02246 family)
MIRKRALHAFRIGLISVFLFSLIICMNAFIAQNNLHNEFISLIEKARNAWIVGDVNALTQLFTPDGELIVPGQRWQGRERIREEVSKFAQQYTEVNITIQRVIVEGNQAAVQWHYEDTERATGKRSKADDAILIEFKNGHIRYWREYFDTETPK